MNDAEQRFTAIYDSCRQRVWAYACARSGRETADEVVSETFAIAWRRLDDVPAPALPWLLGVARNVLRDGYRAEVRRAAFTAELAHRASQAAGDVAEEVAERQAVLNALATLSEEDREVLILTAWQGLGPKEAAKVLGCRPTALRVRLHRARRRLTQATASPPTRTHPTKPHPAGAVSAEARPAGARQAARSVRPQVEIIGKEMS